MTVYIHALREEGDSFAAAVPEAPAAETKMN